jgi:site-specific recombinase XerD
LVSAENKRLVADFLTEKKSQKKSKNTVKQYEQDMRIILTYIYRHFDNKSLLKLTRKDVRNLAMMFIERDLSAARVNRLIGTLRVALSYFEDDEDHADYIVNVAAKVRGLAKNPVRTITFLSEDQIFWLKDALVERKKTLMAVYLMLSYMSGGRRNEVHQVLKDGLTERFKTNVVTGKRSKKFPLYYDQVTQDLIRQYLEERGPDDIPELFVKVYANGRKALVHPSTFNEWCDQMSELVSCHYGRNIPMNPHCFRHSRVEHLCRVKKFPLEKVKSLVNHASVATTETYLADRSEDDVMELFEFGQDEANFHKVMDYFGIENAQC